MRFDEKQNCVIVLQPAVPTYRVQFFESLSEQLSQSFNVYHGDIQAGIITDRAERRPWERVIGELRSLPFGFSWQAGVSGLSIDKGDVVVLSGAPKCLSNFLLIAKCKLAGAKTIWWGHYLSPGAGNKNLQVKRFIYRLVNSVLLYTEEEADELSRHGFSSKVRFLNNGISTEPIEKLRSGYMAAKRPRRILFIGRLTSKSKILLLVKAMSFIRGSSIMVDVIGDGELKSEAINLSQRLGVEDNFVWHGATTEESEIAKIANEARLFVYPGSIGLSLMHAFAYGLPVLIHDRRRLHMPEISAFEHEKNGASFRFDDETSLAKMIEELVDSPIKLSELSKFALRTVREDYNVVEMAKRFVDTIEAVTSP